MAQRIANLGTVANDGTGTNLRTFGGMVDDNFSELYSLLGDGSNILIDIGVADPGDSALPTDGQILAWSSDNNRFEPATVIGTVSSVAISGTGGITVTGSPITGDGTIALSLDSVPNSSLANSSVSFGGVSVSLGSSDATPAFDLSDATKVPLVGAVTKDTFTAGQLLIGNSSGNLDAATLTEGDNVTITNATGTVTIALATTLDISGSTVTYRPIVNADIDDSAAIVGSKLDLSTQIGTTIQAYDANTAKTDVAQTFTKAQRSEITALTSGTTVTPDFSESNHFSLTLDTNATLAKPSNLVAGQTGSIFITQDSTGSRTLSFNTAWVFVNSEAPVLSTTASAEDRLDYIVRSTTEIHAVLSASLAAPT